jgi:hypothetical protein
VENFAENAAPQQSQRQLRSPGVVAAVDGRSDVVAAVDEYLRADTTYTRAMDTLLTQAADTSGESGGEIQEGVAQLSLLGTPGKGEGEGAGTDDDAAAGACNRPPVQLNVITFCVLCFSST